jgi:hypothetical protein
MTTEFQLNHFETFKTIKALHNVLDNTSDILGKKTDFLFNLFTKFALQFPNNCDSHLNELMKEDDIYLILFFIVQFIKDYGNISEDDTIIVIYFVYIHFLDDRETNISELMPCIEHYKIKQVSDIIINISLKYSNIIFKINNDLTFNSRWVRYLNKFTFT